MTTDQIISFDGRKTWIRVFVSFATAILIMICFVFSQDIFAGQSDIIPQSSVIDFPETRPVKSLPASGTNVVEVDENKINNSWQVVRMRVTAYCPCSKCCGEYADGITACNHRIQPGDVFVAADDSYEFGTEMVIPGYNSSQPVKVLDRGGAIKGDRIDAFFHTHQEALEWGVQYLDVRVKIR